MPKLEHPDDALEGVVVDDGSDAAVHLSGGAACVAHKQTSLAEESAFFMEHAYK